MIKERRNIPLDKLQLVADALKTISHPIRLEIMEILEYSEPLTVTDLRETMKIEVEQSLLSHHLIKMKDKGILMVEKQGKYSYYRLKDRQMLKIFDCMEQCEFIK